MECTRFLTDDASDLDVDNDLKPCSLTVESNECVQALDAISDPSGLATSACDAACSVTDHQYAYSPPPSEGDLIRNALGLPQDHDYFLRHSPVARQPFRPLRQSLSPMRRKAQTLTPDIPTLATVTSGTNSELSPEPCTKPCLMMESCPPEWESTVDERAGHSVSSALGMGITAGYRQQEEEAKCHNEDGGRKATTGLFDNVLLDHDLWESPAGLAVVDERGLNYVVLDVPQPDSVLLNGTLDEAAMNTSEQVKRGAMLDGNVEALAAADSLDYHGNSELLVSASDSELTGTPVRCEPSQVLQARDSVQRKEHQLPPESGPHLTDVLSMPSERNSQEASSMPAVGSATACTLPADRIFPRADLTRRVSVEGESSRSVSHSLLAEPDASSTLQGSSPEEKVTQPPDCPPYDTLASSKLPYSCSSKLEESPMSEGPMPAPVANTPTHSLLRTTVNNRQFLAKPKCPPAVKPSVPQRDNNMIISRTVDINGLSPPPLLPTPPSPAPPSRVPVPTMVRLGADPAAMVRNWLRRRAESKRPVTRAQLRDGLAMLLSPEQRQRLSKSSPVLARWLDLLNEADVEKGMTVERASEREAEERQARLSFPSYFKLLLLRFGRFMPLDEVATAFCVPLSIVYGWIAKRQTTGAIDCVRTEGAEKKKRSTEVYDEFHSWLKQREDLAEKSSYKEKLSMAKYSYTKSGRKVPSFHFFQREYGVRNQHFDGIVVRWLLSEFELGICTSKAALKLYGSQPGGWRWADRLLALYPALGRPLNTWQMTLPEPLLMEAELWAGSLRLVPPRAVTVMVDVPIVLKPAPCAVWDYEDSEHLATLLISCTLEGLVLPPLLILKGSGCRVYSTAGDSSGLLVTEQEAGRLDVAKARLWLQLIGCCGSTQLLLLNSYCAPQPDMLRSAAGCKLALVPSGLAAAANPLMATRQLLMMSIVGELSLEDVSLRAALLTAVRSQLVGWGDDPQLRQDLARARRLYSPPVG